MSDIEHNKRTAIAFYNALAQGQPEVLKQLGRPGYIQHNPDFETGLEGLLQVIANRPPRPPLAFVKVIAEGDLVMTLRRIVLEDGREKANVDIFRLEDGKVAEHWDYMETFPRSDRPDRNGNGRF